MSIKIPLEEIKNVPEQDWDSWCTTMVGGTDDVYTFTGSEIREMYQDGIDSPETHKGVFVEHPTLLDLLKWNLSEQNGNNARLLTIRDGKIVEVDWSPLFE
jgi:hypothetical protein